MDLVAEMKQRIDAFYARYNEVTLAIKSITDELNSNGVSSTYHSDPHTLPSTWTVIIDNMSKTITEREVSETQSNPWIKEKPSLDDALRKLIVEKFKW